MGVIIMGVIIMEVIIMGVIITYGGKLDDRKGRFDGEQRGWLVVSDVGGDDRDCYGDAIGLGGGTVGWVQWGGTVGGGVQWGGVQWGGYSGGGYSGKDGLGVNNRVGDQLWGVIIMG